MVVHDAVLAAVAFGAWTLILALALVSARGVAMLRGERAINEFPAGVQHGGDRYWRLNRAHMNACENVGIVAAILLAAAIAGVGGPAARALPMAIVIARVVQSLVHIASGSAMAVQLRFAAYFVQLASLLWIAVEIFRTARG